MSIPPNLRRQAVEAPNDIVNGTVLRLNRSPAPLVRMPTVLTNQILNGKYRLLAQIGRGGMGRVYLALHTSMQRQVAIKVLPAEWMRHPSYLERFRREALAAAALDHPNIVRAYDFDQSGDVCYLVMEYVEGQNLASVVKKREQPLPVDTVVRWMIQAASALHHAHVRDIVHRDVKPSNLLVTKDDNIKLLDLGLARIAGTDGSSLTVANQERVMGTVDYLAPEQALDSHNVDARADIYGLGCTMYFALTGRPPFAEGTIGQRIAQHQSAPVKSLRDCREDVPGELDDICTRMLAKDPNDRYPSAAEVARALADCLDSLGFHPEHAPVTSAQPQLHPIAKLAEIAHLDESTSSVRSRIGLPSRAKRPPILLWIALIFLSGVALVLAWIVYERGL